MRGQPVSGMMMWPAREDIGWEVRVVAHMVQEAVHLVMEDGDRHLQA